MRRDDYRTLMEHLEHALFCAARGKAVQAELHIKDAILFLECQQTLQPGKVRGMPFAIGDDKRRNLRGSPKNRKLA